MTYFAQRDAQGKIQGLFRNRQPQPDSSDLTDPKVLADDDPEVLAYLNPPQPPSPAQQTIASIKADPVALAALKDAVKNGTI